MGISNGNVGPTTDKGIKDVSVNGVPLTGGEEFTSVHRGGAAGAAALPSAVAPRQWAHRWGLLGETRQIFDPASTGKVAWSPAVGETATHLPYTWFRARFDRPTVNPHATQTAFALNLSSMNKGAAFFNGFALGRYWLVAGACNGACAPPIKNGHCYMHWKGCGRPTQTIYQVPTELVRPRGNLVVLFEEAADTVQRRDLSRVRLIALHEHPSMD
jgi:hypothetical protein